MRIIQGESTLLWSAYDYEGNIEDAGYLTFKIDFTAPVIKLFSMTRAGFFKWKYTANVSDNTSGINRVEFYLDDQLVGTCSTYPYIYYWMGVLFFYRLKNLILYHTTWIVANCVAYDDAGNNQVPPIPIP
jgi:hypothetical protein